MTNEKKTGSLKTQRLVSDIIVHTILSIMAVIWIIPLVWLVLISFRGEPGNNVTTFIPTSFTLNNYIKLFTETTVINFPRMFMNTLFISVCSCIISTFFVLAVSFALSRLRWRMRKTYMNMAMVITLFPGFMSMMAVYFLLKAMGLTEGNMIPLALIINFCSGAGVGFHVMKGYMDTIPFALDEAGMLDGATRWQVFIKIILPLCKPMIVYQVITSFLGPWVDFIFAKMICRTSTQYYTVSVGLYTMLEKEYVFQWFNSFAAGAVLISIPISILFIAMQNCYQEAMGGAVKG